MQFIEPCCRAVAAPAITTHSKSMNGWIWSPIGDRLARFIITTYVWQLMCTQFTFRFRSSAITRFLFWWYIWPWNRQKRPTTMQNDLKLKMIHFFHFLGTSRFFSYVILLFVIDCQMVTMSCTRIRTYSPKSHQSRFDATYYFLEYHSLDLHAIGSQIGIGKLMLTLTTYKKLKNLWTP